MALPNGRAFLETKMVEKKFTRKKKAPELEETKVIDDIEIGDIVSDLKKDFKVAFSDERVFSLEDDEGLQIKYWISCPPPLEKVMGGAKGVPCGLVTLFQGPSDSGKTTAAIHQMIQTQRDGGIAVICLTEPKFSKERAIEMGLDVTRTIMLRAKTVEEAEEKLAIVMKRIRAKYPDKKICIVWDSIGYSKCQKEVDSKKHNNMWKASAIKTMMGTMQIWLDDGAITLIGINHTYSTQMGGKKGTGGEGLKLSAAMILDFTGIGRVRKEESFYKATCEFDYDDFDGNSLTFKEGDEVPKELVLGVVGDKEKKGMKKAFKDAAVERISEKEVVGTKTIVKNVKNHIGIPFQEVEIEIDKYGIVWDRKANERPQWK